MNNLLDAIKSAYRKRDLYSGVFRMQHSTESVYVVFTSIGGYEYHMSYNMSNVVAVFSAASTIDDLLRQFESELKVNFLENELKIKN